MAGMPGWLGGAFERLGAWHCVGRAGWGRQAGMASGSLKPAWEEKQNWDRGRTGMAWRVAQLCAGDGWSGWASEALPGMPCLPTPTIPTAAYLLPPFYLPTYLFFSYPSTSPTSTILVLEQTCICLPTHLENSPFLFFVLLFLFVIESN